MRNHRVPAAVGALALTVGASVIPAAAIAGKQASKPKVKTITVADNYFTLTR